MAKKRTKTKVTQSLSEWESDLRDIDSVRRYQRQNGDPAMGSDVAYALRVNYNRIERIVEPYREARDMVYRQHGAKVMGPGSYDFVQGRGREAILQGRAQAAKAIEAMEPIDEEEVELEVYVVPFGEISELGSPDGLFPSWMVDTEDTPEEDVLDTLRERLAELAAGDEASGAHASDLNELDNEDTDLSANGLAEAVESGS